MCITTHIHLLYSITMQLCARAASAFRGRRRRGVCPRGERDPWAPGGAIMYNVSSYTVAQHHTIYNAILSITYYDMTQVLY